jgi:hypothetical protein
VPTVPTTPTTPEDTPAEHEISDVNFYIVDDDGNLTVVKIDDNTDTEGDGKDYSQPQELEDALETEYGGDMIGYSVKAANNFFHYAQAEDGSWDLVAYSLTEGGGPNATTEYFMADENGSWSQVSVEDYNDGLAALFPQGATPEDQSDSDITYASIFGSDSLFGEAGGGGGGGGVSGQQTSPSLDGLLDGGDGGDA